jgi:hypothetical protein
MWFFGMRKLQKIGTSQKPIFYKHLNVNTLKISKSKKIGTKPF